jgi:hypothetical protein
MARLRWRLLREAVGTAAIVATLACGNPPSPKAATAAPVADTAVALDASHCGSFDDGTYGKKWPWQGYTSGAKQFACNVCRGGYANLQGDWRFVDFASEDPATPVTTLERLRIDGNTWSDRIRGDEGGKTVEQTLSGWYFCSDAAEMPSMDAVFVIDKAEPDGAFGNRAGTVFRATVKVKMGHDNQIALGLSNGIDGPFIGEFAYCKVGTTVGGHPCLDPFAAP